MEGCEVNGFGAGVGREGDVWDARAVEGQRTRRCSGEDDREGGYLRVVSA